MRHKMTFPPETCAHCCENPTGTVWLCKKHSAVAELLTACIKAEKTLNIIANLYGGHTEGTESDTLEARKTLCAAISKAGGYAQERTS